MAGTPEKFSAERQSGGAARINNTLTAGLLAVASTDLFGFYNLWNACSRANMSRAQCVLMLSVISATIAALGGSTLQEVTLKAVSCSTRVTVYVMPLSVITSLPLGNATIVFI